MVRSVRFVFALGELLTLVLAILLLMVLLEVFQGSIRADYVSQQSANAAQVDALLQVYIEEDRNSFDAFTKITDQASAVSLMTGFSDMYFVNDALVLTRIIKKAPNSLLFEGFDFSRNRLAPFIKSIRGESASYSAMYRAAENDELSVYLVALLGNEWLVGRIGLVNLRKSIKLIAGYTHSVIVIASKDGYIMSSSQDTLPLQVLPDASQGDITIGDETFFFSRMRSTILDDDIVIITPHSAIEYMLGAARRMCILMIAVISLLLLIKASVQSWLILQPLTRFSESVSEWTPTRGALSAPARSMWFTELSSLHGKFQALTQRVEEAMASLRQNETRLSQNEAKYRELVQNANSIILRMDTSGRIEFFNEFAQSFFGYSEGEIAGLNIEETILRTSLQPGALPLRQILDNPEAYPVVEGAATRRSGETVWVAWTIKAIQSAEGDSTEILCVGNDVTDRREIETQLRQSQKMEAVGRLAGGVAHDFNNLLQAILGYTALLLTNEQPGSDRYDDIHEIQKAAKRAADLTSQLLAFSRRQVLSSKTLNLNEVVTELLKMVRRIIGENIRLEFAPGSEIGTVYADRGQIEQVIMNLCVNARDSMETGGLLTLETKQVHLDEAYCRSHAWAKPGRFVCISVQDTGCGMSQDTLAHVFEPFFTTKETGKGTGLGLATVYGIVQQHGGLVRVQSQPDEGTLFEIHIPSVDTLVTPEEETNSEMASGGTETILFAEDDQQVRSFTIRVLRRAGYRVLAACDGEEAVRIYHEVSGRVDLLLLDVIMPVMGGREAFNMIRDERPDIKCLFASGYSQDALGAVDKNGASPSLIQKPFETEMLLKMIRKVLDTSA